MSEIDPRSISDVLRRVAVEANNHGVAGAGVAFELADRLSLEGAPRVGDYVEALPILDRYHVLTAHSKHPSPDRGIVFHCYANERRGERVEVVWSDGRCTSPRPTEVRVVARCPWSLDDLEQTR